MSKTTEVKPEIKPLVNKVKLGQFEITYADVTVAEIAKAGMAEVLHNYGIGKLRAHKLNTAVWDRFAKEITGSEDQGAAIRKKIVEAKIKLDLPVAEYYAAVATAINSDPAKVQAAHEAAQKFALTLDHVAALKAERAPREPDADLTLATAILADPTGKLFAAFKAYAAKQKFGMEIANEIGMVRLVCAMLRTAKVPFVIPAAK